MKIEEVIEVLASSGIGDRDFLTGETVIESAQLDEDINGDGGLSLSWKSTRGGVIRAASLLTVGDRQFVMEKNYVPTLGDDGMYQWSPKWSEPAALLKGVPYGKGLQMLTANQDYNIKGEVVAVVESLSGLPDSNNYNIGDKAIVLNAGSGNGVYVVSEYHTGNTWSEYDGTIADGDIYTDSDSGEYWQFDAANYHWTKVSELSTLYTYPYAGSVGTAIEDMNTFLGTVLPDFMVILHDDDNQTLASTYVVCTFDGCNVKAAIEEIANKAGEAYSGEGAVNLYYVGKEIHIGLSNAYAGDEYYNRFILLGGTKNMAKRVPAGNAYAAVTQRLSIPAGTYTVNNRSVTVEEGSVIDMRDDPQIEAPFTRFLVYDSIYPKLDMKILTATSRLCYLLDDKGEKISDGASGYKMYAKWYVTLTLDGTHPYTINTRYIIQDKPLSLLFQSGPLTGREFELTFLPSGTHEHEDDDVSPDGHTVPDKIDGDTPIDGEYRIIIKADGDVLLPGLPAENRGGLCPQERNMVTLVNVAIEDKFKDVAIMELLKKGESMARLIYAGKVPTYDEERTQADFLTGMESVKSLGEKVGDDADGYIVTGISTDLITGKQTFSYGTFKPRGILSSAIDQIGSLSLSGGEATFAPLVEVRDEGAEQIIYVSTPTDDTDSTSAGQSQTTSTTIRQAGGNTNIRTVYNRLAAVEQLAKEADALATLIQEVYADAESAIKALKTQNGVTQYLELDFTGYSSTRYYSFDDNTLYKQGSQVSDKPLLTGAFASAREVVGSIVIKLFNTTGITGVELAKYDLCAVPIGFNRNNTTIDGGVQGWMYDGISWQVILETTTAIIDNLGNAINLVVFGSQNTDAQAAGMLTTQNFVELFAQSITPTGNDTLAEAFLAIGIKYGYIPAPGQDYVDITWNHTTRRWEYPNGTVYTGKLTPYSFAGIQADKITFTANDYLRMAVNSGSNNSVGLVASKTDNGTMLIGAFDSNQNLLAGLTFTHVSNSWKLGLTADNCTIDADTITFSGKTISLGGTGANKLTINGGNVLINSGNTLTFTSGGSGSNTGSINFAAANVVFRADNTIFEDSTGESIALFSDDKISLTTSNCTIDADVISAMAGDVGFVIEKEDESGSIRMGHFDSDNLVAGLKFTQGSETVNGQTNTFYTLDLTADKINLNAEQINWKGSTREEGGQTVVVPREVIPGKFEVDNDGNVTMNHLTANNGTFQGTLKAAVYDYKVYFHSQESSIPDDVDYIVCYTSVINEEINLPSPADVPGKIITIKNPTERTGTWGTNNCLLLTTQGNNTSFINLDDYSHQTSGNSIPIGEYRTVVVWSGKNPSGNYQWHILDQVKF